MESMFSGCVNLKDLNLMSFNTSRCSNFKYMFEQCEDLYLMVDINSVANMLDNIDLEKIHPIELNDTIDSNEINTLNSSFGDIASKFE